MAEKEYLFADQANARVDELMVAVSFMASVCRLRTAEACRLMEECPAWRVCQGLAAERSAS